MVLQVVLERVSTSFVTTFLHERKPNNLEKVVAKILSKFCKILSQLRADLEKVLMKYKVFLKKFWTVLEKIDKLETFHRKLANI